LLISSFTIALMKASGLTVVLFGLNVLLALALRVPQQTNPLAPTMPAPPSVDSTRKSNEARQIPKPRPAPETAFAAVYSPDAKTFVANLRAIGCPEETIKDILSAEMNRRYSAREEALRPKPADHVPFGWSAKTSEGKLIERRQEAAAIAREKRSALRAALGYEVAVAMPQYAMTTSDQLFDRFLDSLPLGKRAAAQSVQDDYWQNVQTLRSRTRGFWQAQDISELEEFKSKRRTALAQLEGAQ
jgi:hypothetical protein